MIFPIPPPVDTIKPRIGITGVSTELYNSAGQLIERKVTNAEGWTYRFSGTFAPFLNEVATLVNEIGGASVRARNTFSFTRVQARATTPGVPYNLTAIFVNGVNFLAAPVNLTDTVTFFECSLLPGPYNIEENSLMQQANDGGASNIDMKFIT